MKKREEMPFTLNENENLELDIFVDKAVVEVYANERQAICRPTYPTNPENAVGVKFIGNKENVLKLEAYSMAPANPY